jgi:hypothetical protein
MRCKVIFMITLIHDHLEQKPNDHENIWFGLVMGVLLIRSGINKA